MCFSQDQGIIPAQASFLFPPTLFGLWECYKMRWSVPVLKPYKMIFFMTCRICFFQGWPIFFSSRCQWISHCPPSPGPAWKSLGESGGTDSNVPVLARGEQDGFYYPGTVKEGIEVSDGCYVIAGSMCNREQPSHTTWVQCSSFWFFSVAVFGSVFDEIREQITRTAGAWAALCWCWALSQPQCCCQQCRGCCCV